jgi:hypothetical protein
MEEDYWFCGEVEEPEPPKAKVINIEREEELGFHNFSCVLCGRFFSGYGHNPSPLKEEGRCCNGCNSLVIATRIAVMMK